MRKLNIPDTVSNVQLQLFARATGCMLGKDEFDEYHLIPIKKERPRPVHTNATIVKFPRHKNQLHGNAGNTTPPKVS